MLYLERRYLERRYLKPKYLEPKYLEPKYLEPRYLEPMRYARIFLANNLPFKWTVNRPNARIWQLLADGWGNYPKLPLLCGQQNNVAAFQ